MCRFATVYHFKRIKEFRLNVGFIRINFGKIFQKQANVIIDCGCYIAIGFSPGYKVFKFKQLHHSIKAIMLVIEMCLSLSLSTSPHSLPLSHTSYLLVRVKKQKKQNKRHILQGKTFGKHLTPLLSIIHQHNTYQKFWSLHRENNLNTENDVMARVFRHKAFGCIVLPQRFTYTHRI